MKEKAFNLRAYGLLINANREILIVREKVKDKIVTKFPGGGLEFGEGLTDCVIREFKEELNIEVKVKAHFYTTDFFVESFFNPNHQVISVYYLVKTDAAIDQKYNSKLKDELSNGEMSFSWLPSIQLNADIFTLPIDKHVSILLRNYLLIEG